MVQYHRKSYVAYFFAKICCPYLDIRGTCCDDIFVIWRDRMCIWKVCEACVDQDHEAMLPDLFFGDSGAGCY